MCKMDEPYPEGENPREFYHRVEASFREICESDVAKNQNIMIITHGGVINIIYHLVKGIEWTNKSPYLSRIHCMSIHQINYRNDEWGMGTPPF